MWRKYRIIFQNHLKYICNDVVNPFRVTILHYVERVVEIHDLAKHLPPPFMKGGFYEAYNWKFCDKGFSVHEIRFAIKDLIPSSMQDELEDNQEDYHFMDQC